MADNQLFHIKTDKESYGIGDKVQVTLLSSSKDLVVSVFIEKDRKIVDTQIIRLNDNSKSFSIPVNGEDLGGFAINYSFSAFNSFQSGSLAISVPYPKTDLEIETLTFRDKLQPGTDEKWSFKIKGPKGNKVAAELLASMYDASLDAFRGHNWNFNPLMRPTYYSNSYTNANASFGTASFRTYLDNNTYSFKPQYYDSLEWFGLYFGSRGYYRDGLTRRMRKSEGTPLGMVAKEMDMEESVADAIQGRVGGVEIASAPAVEDKAFGTNKPKRQQPEKERKEEKNGQETDFGDVKIRKNLNETAFFLSTVAN